MAVTKEELARREQMLKTIQDNLDAASVGDNDKEFLDYVIFLQMDQYIHERHESYRERIREQLEMLNSQRQGVDDTLRYIMAILDNE